MEEDGYTRTREQWWERRERKSSREKIENGEGEL